MFWPFRHLHKQKGRTRAVRPLQKKKIQAVYLQVAMAFSAADTPLSE